MRVLIPHGTTPTGFGIGQLDGAYDMPEDDDDQWARFVVLTPCCGGTLPSWTTQDKYRCSGCDKDYSTHPVANDWNLTYIADISRKVMEEEDVDAVNDMCETAVDWMKGITGEDMEVEIKW